MNFPDYELGKYQALWNSKAQHRMCAAALSPPSIKDVFSLATEEELLQWNSLSLSYATEKGDFELRTSIAKQYPGLTADNIVTFCGTQEALFCAMHATIQADDHTLTIDPSYEPLAKIPDMIGARVSKISLRVSDSKNTPEKSKQFPHWSLPLEELSKTAQTGFQQLVINFPHNPTGCLIDRKTQQALIDCCTEQDAWLISDEVFRGLEHDPTDQLPPIASLYTKGISLGTIGKPFGLGGARIGWIACQDKRILEKTIQIKRSLSICSSRLDEWLAKIVLNNADYFLLTTRKLLNDHIKILNDDAKILSKYGVFNWIGPQAGCIAFPSLPDKINIDRFANDFINKEKIMIIPGKCFSENVQYQQHFRLGYGLKEFPEIWNQFFKFIEHY